MSKRLLKRIDAPTASADERRQARTLFWSLLIFALGALVYIPISTLLLHQPVTLELAAGLAPALIIPALTGWLVNRGRRRAANTLFTLGMWVYTTGLLLLTPGGFADGPGAALLLASVLAAVSLPPGLGLLTTILYAASIAGVGMVQFTGWLPVLSAPREAVLLDGSLLLLVEVVSGLALNVASRQAARAARAADARTQELETLLDIGRQASASLELDRMLDDVAEALVSAFDVTQAQILLVERGGAFAELHAAAGKDAPEPHAGDHLRLSQTTTAGQVVVARTPVLNPSDGLDSSVQLPAAYAELGLPLLHNDKVIGVLVLRAAEVGFFTARTIDLFESFAAQLSGAIHNAQTVATEAALLEARSPILNAACQIAAADAPHQIVLSIQETVAGWADYIALLVAEDEALSTAAVWHREGTPPDLTYPATLLDALQESDGLISGEAQMLDAGLRASIAEPLRAAELVLLALRRSSQTVGALVLAGARTASYSDADLQALNLLARPTAIMLSNLQHIDQLEATTTRANQLYDAVQEMSAASTPQGVYEVALREIIQIMGADRALIFAATEDEHSGESVVRRVAIWQDGRAVTDTDGPDYPDTPTPSIWQIPLTREDRLFNDVQNDTRLVRPLRNEYRRREVNALAAIPMSTTGRWLGSVVIEAQQGQDFDEAQVAAAHRVADTAARLLYTIHVLDQLGRAAEREMVVNHIAGNLENAPSLPLLLRSAVDQLAELLGTSSVYAELNMGETQPPSPEPTKLPGSNGHHSVTADEEVRTQS